MKTMKSVFLFLILACFLAFHDYIEAQHKLPHSVIGNGGIAANNGSYRLNSTVGQPGIGVVSNPSNINEAGFWYQVGNILTSIETVSNSLPEEFRLYQNYPNPFNPSTTIEFALPKSAFVTLKVYNLLGEEVATLIGEQRAAGIHRFNWDARGLASGVYLYRLEAGGFVQSKKLILMR
jgi:hypothetical protein